MSEKEKHTFLAVSFYLSKEEVGRRKKRKERKKELSHKSRGSNFLRCKDAEFSGDTNPHY
jgi:hypothetical protein